MLLLSSAALLGSWTLGWLVTSAKRPASSASAVFVGLLAFYGWRSATLAVQLDQPFPRYLFGQDWQGSIIDANLALCVWILVFTGAVVVSSPLRLGGGRLSSAPTEVLRKAAVLLTVLGLALFLVIFAQFGSLSDTQAALRLGSAGFIFLSIPSQAGVLLSAAVFYSEDRQQTWSFAALLWAINCVVLFGWGSRSPVLISVLAVVLLAVDSRAADGRRRARRPLIPTALLGALAILALAFGLRTVRDASLGGNQLGASENVGAIESVSRASNATMFDGFALATRDFDSRFEFGAGEIFWNGTVALVPRAIWQEKPVDVAPGKWFRRLYEPDRLGGWPIWAPGEWWVSFGPVGIVVGAALSGLLVGGFDVASGQGVSQRCKIIAVLWGFLLFPTGFHAQLPTRAVMWWIVPVLAVRATEAVLFRRRLHV